MAGIVMLFSIKMVFSSLSYGAGLFSVTRSYINPQELYAVGGCSAAGWWDYGNYIYHSDDHGTTWELISSPQPLYPVGSIIHSLPDETLVFSRTGQNSVFISFSGGIEWTNVSLGTSGTHLMDIASVPDQQGKAWAVGYASSSDYHDATLAYLWTTEDSGQTWSYDDIITTPASAYGISVSAGGQTVYIAGESSSEPVLWKSDDSGATWTDITPSMCSGEGAGLDVAVDPFNGQFIIFSTVQNVYRSDDCGANWTVVSSVDNIFDIRFALEDSSRVVAARESGLLISNDSGVSWTYSEYLPAGTVLKDFTMVPDNPDSLVVASDGGILTTADAGVSWSSGNSGIMLSSTFDVTDATCSSPRIYMILDGEVAYSDDLGSSWTVCSSQPDGLVPSWSNLCVNPQNAQNAITTGMYGEIFMTQNAGNSWSVIDDSLSAVYEACADPSADGVFYVAGNYESGGQEYMRIGKTIDSGVSWSFSDLGDSPATSCTISLDPSHPDTVYAGGDYYNTDGQILLRSLNGGTSWQPVQTNIPGGYSIYSIAVSPFDNWQILITCEDGVYRTADFGNTWTRELDSQNPYFALFDPCTEDRAWLWQESYPFTGIGVSNDGGQTWEECNDGLPLYNSVNSIAFVYPQWMFASTSGSLFKLNLLDPSSGITEGTGDGIMVISVQPNPVVTTASISYSSSGPDPVEFTVFDMAGRVVQQFSTVPETRGANTVNWDPSEVSLGNGIYFLVMESGRQQAAGRLVLCR